jgi:hypothetical protein
VLIWIAMTGIQGEQLFSGLEELTKGNSAPTMYILPMILFWRIFNIYALVY